MESKCECKDCGFRESLFKFVQGEDEDCKCPKCGGDRIRFYYFDIDGYDWKEIREAYTWWNKLPNYKRGRVKCEAICAEYFGDKK